MNSQEWGRRGDTDDAKDEAGILKTRQGDEEIRANLRRLTVSC